MSVTSFDFGELFTVSARPVVAAALKRGVSCHFDYACGPSRIEGDAQSFQRGFYRVIAAASEVLESGSLILVAEVTSTAEPGVVHLRIDAASSGQRTTDRDVDELLKEMQLVKSPPGPDAVDEVTAAGTCPVLGGELIYRCVPSAGALFSFSMRCAGELLADAGAPQAHGNEAVLWHDPLQPGHDLARRLQRLGWQVTLCRDRGQFDAALALGDGRPRLVLVQESCRLSWAHEPMPHVPADEVGMFVHLVSTGSDTLGVGDTLDWDVRILPLSPSELWDLTRRTRGDAGDDVEEESRPTPLPAAPRPRVLVVDDDEVNRIIASGLLQMLGYDSTAVSSGTEALAACERTPPDLVLMDINMPGLDGYQATAALQRLQRLGAIPPFPILAATAAGTARQSAQHGLDGHLSKPLLAEELRVQLQRALKGLATGL